MRSILRASFPEIGEESCGTSSLSSSARFSSQGTMTCPLCGSGRTAWYSRKKGKDIYRCPDCRGGVAHPLPSIGECMEYYNTEYKSGRYRHRISPQAEELKVRTWRRRAEVLKMLFRSPGKVLDVGCSSGSFLSVMESEGWDVFGIDISQESCRKARMRWKERIRVESLEGNHAAGLFCSSGTGQDRQDDRKGTFDLVTLFDTLEHSPDPRGLLRGVRALLRADGVLAVTTHDFSSYASRLMGRRWSYLDPMEHLFYFSPQSLSALLQAEGFSIVDLKRSGKFVNLAFLLAECEYAHPSVFRRLSPLARAVVPGFVLRRTFFLYMGEIIVFGRKSGEHE